MFDTIEQTIAEHFALTREELLTAKRREATDARHFLWYVLHIMAGYSANVIARQYGVSPRNLVHYSSTIGFCIRHQPFFSTHYRQIADRLKELNII